MLKLSTIPNKNTMNTAATMDNPAPDNDASVKSLGIFLQTEKHMWHKNIHKVPILFTKEKLYTNQWPRCNLQNIKERRKEKISELGVTFIYISFLPTVKKAQRNMSINLLLYSLLLVCIKNLIAWWAITRFAKQCLWKRRDLVHSLSKKNPCILTKNRTCSLKHYS